MDKYNKNQKEVKDRALQFIVDESIQDVIDKQLQIIQSSVSDVLSSLIPHNQISEELEQFYYTIDVSRVILNARIEAEIKSLSEQQLLHKN